MHTRPILGNIFEKAILAHRAGDFRSAEKQYKIILKSVPDHPEVIHLLGVIEFQKRNYTRAEILIAKAIKLGNQSSSVYFNLGNVYFEKKRMDDAITAYKKAISTAPNYVDAIRNLGNCYYQAGLYDDAIVQFNHIISLNQADFNAKNSLGLVYLRQGETSKAYTSFYQAHEISNSAIEPIYNLGRVCAASNDTKQALEYFNTAIELDPHHISSYIEAINLLLKTHNINEAFSLCSAALSANPNDFGLLICLGNIHKEKRDFASAANSYKNSIKLNKINPGAYENLGHALAELGNKKEAMAAYQRALELNPDNTLVRHAVNSLAGHTTDKAPAEYVKTLFDEYADNFDEHLTAQLEYNTPKLIKKIFTEYLESSCSSCKLFNYAVDLGCGTGLSGEEFVGMSSSITGIDISPKMLRIAKEKNIYDELLEGDLESSLSLIGHKPDLFIAADVFVYIGDLFPIFRAIKKIASDSSYLVFSTEHANGRNYRLNESGRYSHSAEHIENIAQSNNMEISCCQRVNLRKDKGSWIIGDIYIVKVNPENEI